MIHTGDVSHLSHAEQFDTAEQIIGGAGLDTHYVPGEHDVLVDDGKPFFERFTKGGGKGYYSFDQQGVHFVGLNNVQDLKAGGLGNLGHEQLEWLENDLKGRSASQPIVVFAHVPLWRSMPSGAGAPMTGPTALAYLKRFGSVTVLNGHIHQIMQKVEGHVAFHTARSTAFPQPAPGTAPSPGPMKNVPAGQLRSLLGVTSVTQVTNPHAARHRRYAARRLTGSSNLKGYQPKCSFRHASPVGRTGLEPCSSASLSWAAPANSPSEPPMPRRPRSRSTTSPSRRRSSP